MSNAQQTVFRLKGRQSIQDLSEPLKEAVPTAGKGEVVIKVRAVSLNYRDFAISCGLYPFPVKDDLVPCSDLAGEVVQVGDDVSHLSKGDKVTNTFNPEHLYGPQKDWTTGLGGPRDGTLRQFISLPAKSVVKLPDDDRLSFAQWSVLPCTGVTSWNALYGNIQPRAGQTVLCIGTGGVSTTTIQLAKAAGLTTIITSSSDDKLNFVKEKYGADYGINYRTTPNWAEEAKKITNGRGVDYVIENGGAGTIKQSIDAIVPGGVIAVIGFLAQVSQDDMPDVASLALGKGCVVRGINIGPTSMLEEVVRVVAERKLTPPVEKVFKFERDEIIKAYELLKSGTHVGKICIEVQ